MKIITLMASLALSPILTFGQSQNQEQILNNFIRAHNAGTTQAIEGFINEFYSPDLLKRVNMETQVNFYQQIINEFGSLNKATYKLNEETNDHLVVWLIKENENIVNQNINAAEILVVEMDTSPKKRHISFQRFGIGFTVVPNEKISFIVDLLKIS